MVNISIETLAQTHERLAGVIRRSRLKVYEGAYIFEEFPLMTFRDRADRNALALVRDDAVWSQLVEYYGPIPHNGSIEIFCLWRFHFPADVDNSGFVGWLASHLKECFGTGVFVVCGQNSGDEGIFDYWGGPLELRRELIAEIERLMR